jgi:hypothetical protein
LRESLASRQLAQRTVLDKRDEAEPQQSGLAQRVVSNMRRLFAIH